MLEVLAQRRRDDRGFTLIELMIVVLIIGILISVGLPTFLGARNRAQDRAAQAILRNAVTAAKTWYTDNSTYTDFNTAAVLSTKGCPATLPTAPAVTGATVLYASCVEPSIAWTATAITTASPATLVYIKTASANSLCMWTVSANGPALWYASDSGSGTTISTTAC